MSLESRYTVNMQGRATLSYCPSRIPGNIVRFIPNISKDGKSQGCINVQCLIKGQMLTENTELLPPFNAVIILLGSLDT